MDTKSSNDYLSQLDYVLINKKLKIVPTICTAFNSFISVSSDHRIITARFRLTPRANKNKTSIIKPYDWTHLKDNVEIRNDFITEVNK